MFDGKEIDLILNKINYDINELEGDVYSVVFDLTKSYDIFFESPKDKKDSIKKMRSDIKMMKSIRSKLLTMKRELNGK